MVTKKFKKFYVRIVYIPPTAKIVTYESGYDL